MVVEGRNIMKVITLSREFGAGGHSIGKKVAAELGIELYDKDIIKGVAKKSGIDPEIIFKEGEEISRKDTFIRSINPISYDQKDAIFDAEKSVIIELAKKGPCIILGRCADVILAEAGIETIDVFIYADAAHREKRVSELLEISNPSDIQREMKRHDHNRRSYYSYYTDKELGDYKNFDLMLDSGALGNDLCAKLICEAARNS